MMIMFATFCDSLSSVYVFRPCGGQFSMIFYTQYSQRRLMLFEL